MGDRTLNYYQPRPGGEPISASWSIGCAVAALACALTPLLGYAGRSEALFILGLLLSPLGVCVAWVGLVLSRHNRAAVVLSAAGLILNLLGSAIAFWLVMWELG